MELQAEYASSFLPFSIFTKQNKQSPTRIYCNKRKRKEKSMYIKVKKEKLYANNSSLKTSSAFSELSSAMIASRVV